MVWHVQVIQDIHERALAVDAVTTFETTVMKISNEASGYFIRLMQTRGGGCVEPFWLTVPSNTGK